MTRSKYYFILIFSFVADLSTYKIHASDIIPETKEPPKTSSLNPSFDRYALLPTDMKSEIASHLKDKELRNLLFSNRENKALVEDMLKTQGTTYLGLKDQWIELGDRVHKLYEDYEDCKKTIPLEKHDTDPTLLLKRKAYDDCTKQISALKSRLFKTFHGSPSIWKLLKLHAMDKAHEKEKQGYISSYMGYPNLLNDIKCCLEWQVKTAGKWSLTPRLLKNAYWIGEHYFKVNSIKNWLRLKVGTYYPETNPFATKTMVFIAEALGTKVTTLFEYFYNDKSRFEELREKMFEEAQKLEQETHSSTDMTPEKKERRFKDIERLYNAVLAIQLETEDEEEWRASVQMGLLNLPQYTQTDEIAK